MRTARRTLVCVFFMTALAAVAAAVHAQGGTPGGQASAPVVQAESAALFTTYCATCHAGPGANPQAPTLDVMRRMTAEQVLNALEKGAMRTRAAERSRAQRRVLAEYASGKSLAADSGGSMPKSAFCSAAPAAPADPLSGPAWNGWGHSILNTRFQSAAAAGINADQVSRLALKWAFGFPGATSAGSQPVVAGGRVYAATAEGEVYVLDAKTGCIHWTLEV